MKMDERGKGKGREEEEGWGEECIQAVMVVLG